MITDRLHTKVMRVNPVRDWGIIVLGGAIILGVGLFFNAVLFFEVVFGVPLTENRIKSENDTASVIRNVEEEIVFFDERQNLLENIIKNPSRHIDPSK